MTPADINQTVIIAMEYYDSANSVADFSRFDTLLGVAFALNISYKLIPDIMEKVGQQKVKKRETDQITAWQADIEDIKSNEDGDKNKIISLESHITSIYSEADKKTSKLQISQFIHSWIAPAFVALTIMFLFFGALDYCPLESFANKLTIQFWIMVTLLAPNIIAIIFQLLHWSEIEGKLNYLIETLNKKNKSK